MSLLLIFEFHLFLWSVRWIRNEIGIVSLTSAVDVLIDLANRMEDITAGYDSTSPETPGAVEGAMPPGKRLSSPEVKAVGEPVIGWWIVTPTN